jgi:hypothetical protein
MSNAFLADFMKMRRSLGTVDSMPIVTGLSTPSKVKGKKPKDAPEVSKPSPNNMTLAYIIAEKPDADDVCDYFRNRIEQLEEEEDN